MFLHETSIITIEGKLKSIHINHKFSLMTRNGITSFAYKKIWDVRNMKRNIELRYHSLLRV